MPPPIIIGESHRLSDFLGLGGVPRVRSPSTIKNQPIIRRFVALGGTDPDGGRDHMPQILPAVAWGREGEHAL